MRTYAILGWLTCAGIALVPASATDRGVELGTRDLPVSVRVLETSRQGIPTFLRGELARAGDIRSLDRAQTEQRLRAVLGPPLAPFRLAASDLQLRKINADAQGSLHLRYRQVFNGLDVVGGDLVVHVNPQGVVYAINGTARGGIAAGAGKHDIGVSAALAFMKNDIRFLNMTTSEPRLVYFISADGAAYRAYEVEATGMRGADPVRDRVYIDAISGTILGAHPQIHFLKSRFVYSAANGTALPGILMRSEGQGPTSDFDTNGTYSAIGTAYDAYKDFWNRDSFDNAGAVLTSTVHYGLNYCNAFVSGGHLVLGDGDSSFCTSPARSLDVVAHEFTHLVTENESCLVGSFESGGVSESMSDIFAAFTQAWIDGRRTGGLYVSADTWKIAEDFLPPALRFMNDPAADGISLDYWSANAGNAAPSFSAGIGNLAFYLLSQGGTHPRGKSFNNVTGIGMEKAIRIFYKANVDYLTPNATFLAARNATLSAAADLGYSREVQGSVAEAWRAVGVPSPPIDATVLQIGVPVIGLAGAKGSSKYFKIVAPPAPTTLTIETFGGPGDVDLYVRQDNLPTIASYMCRPYLNGNNEGCTIVTSGAGDYYIMLRGYDSYSGVTLQAWY